MKPTLAPLQFLLLVVAGWVNREQQSVIDYLREENSVLREQLGGKRLHLTDAQRRRLAVKGRALGRKLLASVCGIVTPDTILRWYREIVAKKYDGAPKRSPGRAKTRPDVVELVLTMARENPTWVSAARTPSGPRPDARAGCRAWRMQRHGGGELRGGRRAV